MAYTFKWRWKEELLCSCPEGRLVLDLPMGVPTIYVPTRDKWELCAPDWAKARYSEIHLALAAWAESQALPLVIDERAAVTLDDRS